MIRAMAGRWRYPNHYLIAVLWDLETAQRAAKKLRLTGFAEDDVIAVEGQDFIELSEEETGLGSFLMQALSRFLATEQKSHNSDLYLARHGAAFVAVHCPSEKTRQDAWGVLQSETPVAARGGSRNHSIRELLEMRCGPKHPAFRQS